jgi:alpha,alpha-trehalose phosphorylase
VIAAVRDSSLSACAQAVIAAEVGQLGLARHYLGEAARMDLDDLESNTRDGLHIASLAGAWIALVGGFGGMRHRRVADVRAPVAAGVDPADVHRAPARLPTSGGRRRDRGHVHPRRGRTVELRHHGRAFTLTTGEPVTHPVPPVRADPRPQ